jgi:hypothetical protein
VPCLSLKKRRQPEYTGWRNKSVATLLVFGTETGWLFMLNAEVSLAFEANVNFDEIPCTVSRSGLRRCFGLTRYKRNYQEGHHGQANDFV